MTYLVLYAIVGLVIGVVCYPLIKKTQPDSEVVGLTAIAVGVLWPTIVLSSVIGIVRFICRSIASVFRG